MKGIAPSAKYFMQDEEICLGVMGTGFIGLIVITTKMINTIDLTLSKKLKELRAEQESEFYWKVGKSSGKENLVTKHEKPGKSYVEFFDYYSAFTSSELGEMIGNYTLERNEGVHQVGVEVEPLDPYYIYSESMAEAMGEMVAYLTENKLK